jgi:hypothetical protein
MKKMPDIETATAPAAQDVQNRIEEALYPSQEKDEPIETEEEEVLEDAEELPEGDDSDSEEAEGSEDEDNDEVTDEDLSLAAYLGIEEDRLVVDDDGQVTFNAIIDGETKAVPLKELASSYQMQGHVNNKSMALEGERKEFEGKRQEVFTELQTRIEGITQIGQVLEQELVGEYNSIDWNRLRTEDPTQWTVLRQEYAEKAQKVSQAQELIQQETQRIAGQASEEQEKSMSNYLTHQRNEMILKNPDWADKEKRLTALGEMKTFMADTYGYAPDDMDNVMDHRLIEVIKDAKAYRSGKKAAVEKKVKKVPKFQKPGATKQRSASLTKARAVKAKKAAVKKSGGSLQSVAKALEDRM